MAKKKIILNIYTHASRDFQLNFSSGKGNAITMQTICTDPKRTLCLNALKTLCRIFWGPDIELCHDIMDGKFFKLLQDVSGSFGTDMSCTTRAAAQIAGEYEDVAALYAALSDGYISLFINDINGISAPLYHSCYLASDSRLMGPPVMDMINRIERHGLSISLSGNEPADHLCIELEYLYYLLDVGWSESSSKHVQEAVHFAGDLMAGWVCRFCEKITADGRFPFYTISAQLLCSIVINLSESAGCLENRPWHERLY